MVKGLIMLALWWVIFVVVAMVRVCIVALMFNSGQTAAIIFGCTELIANLLGVINAMRASWRDCRPVGLLVPFGYLVIAALFPAAAEPHNVLSLCMLWSGFALVNWSLWHLGPAFSLGAATWVGLVDTGPYAIVRHPQALANFLIVGSVVVAGVEQLEAWKAAASMSLMVLVIATEESALRQFSEWREYAAGVRSRFIPGIF